MSVVVSQKRDLGNHILGKVKYLNRRVMPRLSELCGSFLILELQGLGEFIEDGAVLDHGCAELLGGNFNLADWDSDGMGGTVVFHDTGVGDG